MISANGLCAQLAQARRDFVGIGAIADEVTARLRELGTQTIRGNHDKAVSGLMPTDDFNPVAKSAVDWTRGQLQPDHLDRKSTRLNSRHLVISYAVFCLKKKKKKKIY